MNLFISVSKDYRWPAHESCTWLFDGHFPSSFLQNILTFPELGVAWQLELEVPGMAGCPCTRRHQHYSPAMHLLWVSQRRDVSRNIFSCRVLKKKAFGFSGTPLGGRHTRTNPAGVTCNTKVSLPNHKLSCAEPREALFLSPPCFFPLSILRAKLCSNNTSLEQELQGNRYEKVWHLDLF